MFFFGFSLSVSRPSLFLVALVAFYAQSLFCFCFSVLVLEELSSLMPSPPFPVLYGFLFLCFRFLVLLLLVAGSRLSLLLCYFWVFLSFSIPNDRESCLSAPGFGVEGSEGK